LSELTDKKPRALRFLTTLQRIYKLANWVTYKTPIQGTYRRERKSKMTVFQIRLESLGFGWGVFATTWEDP
jgi:hypothetical protein